MPLSLEKPPRSPATTLSLVQGSPTQVRPISSVSYQTDFDCVREEGESQSGTKIVREPLASTKLPDATSPSSGPHFAAERTARAAWLEVIRALARAAAQQDHDASLRKTQGHR